MTKNTVQRLLLFFLGIPLFVVTVLYASFYRNAILFLVVLAVQIIGSDEAATLFEAKGTKVNKIYVAALSVAMSLVVYLSPVIGGLFARPASPLEVLLGAAIAGCLAIAAPIAFVRAEDFPSTLAKVSASLFVYFYCGVLGSFLVYITSCFGQYSAPVLTFTLMTFGNDSLAWLVGMTLGRKRGIVAVSPGKSLAGFIGGFCGSILAGALAYFLFPEAGFGDPGKAIILGVAMGVSTILGDLVESALKRSASVKDSSALVPGRGGILDSFDSLLFSAPIFALIAAFMGFFPRAA